MTSIAPDHTQTIAPVEPWPLNWNTLRPLLFSDQGMTLLICGLLIVTIATSGNPSLQAKSTRANRKAHAKWAGKKEILAARKVAIKQLHRRSASSACLWITKPLTLEYPARFCELKQLKSGQRYPLAPRVGPIPAGQSIKVMGEKIAFRVPAALQDSYSVKAGTRLKTETLWIPDTQRSVMVVGAPGSGKTFSAIDPMLRSAVDQGYPIILYDFKMPNQTSAIAAYAEQLGYQVRVFAPGLPESDVLNLLDFLTGEPETDAALARQLATTMNRNFRLGQPGSTEPFFEDASDQLVQAVLMLARQMPQADIITVQTILSTPELSTRLLQSQTLNPWIRTAFAQFLAVANSEKTAASIIGMATLNFTRLMMAKLLACCTGKTTLPLDLTGKQMIVFGVDRTIRDVVTPIIATALTMLVNRNLLHSGGRSNPLICVLDEVPTLYLDQLVKWENESRADGFNGIIGFQNKSQLELVYGKETAHAIIGGCATKFIFNSGEIESAEYFSKLFGNEEIIRPTTSCSRSPGQPGSSTTRSLEVSTRSLVSPEELVGLPAGTCIISNPAYGNREMSYLPQRRQIILPPWELELQTRTRSAWDKMRHRLIRQAEPAQQIPTTADIQRRHQEVEAAFPLLQGDKIPPDPIARLAQMF